MLQRPQAREELQELKLVGVLASGSLLGISTLDKCGTAVAAAGTAQNHCPQFLCKEKSQSYPS